MTTVNKNANETTLSNSANRFEWIRWFITNPRASFPGTCRNRSFRVTNRSHHSWILLFAIRNYWTFLPFFHEPDKARFGFVPFSIDKSWITRADSPFGLWPAWYTLRLARRLQYDIKVSRYNYTKELPPSALVGENSEAGRNWRVDD